MFCSLTIKQVNDLLDKVAMGNMEHKKADTRGALQILLRNTSAVEQVLLGSLSLSMSQVDCQKIFIKKVHFNLEMVDTNDYEGNKIFKLHMQYQYFYD